MLARIFGGGIGPEELLTGSHTPASNTAAVVTLSGAAGKRVAVTKVVWSYSADPTNGRLSMTGPTKTPDVDVIKGGPGALQFGACQAGDNTDIVVTLAAGGSGVTGKLYVEGVVTVASRARSGS